MTEYRWHFALFHSALFCVFGPVINSLEVMVLVYNIYAHCISFQSRSIRNYRTDQFELYVDKTLMIVEMVCYRDENVKRADEWKGWINCIIRW